MLKRFTKDTLPEPRTKRMQPGKLDFRPAWCVACEDVVMGNGLKESLSNFIDHAKRSDDAHRAQRTMASGEWRCRGRAMLRRNSTSTTASWARADHEPAEDILSLLRHSGRIQRGN